MNFIILHKLYIWNFSESILKNEEILIIKQNSRYHIEEEMCLILTLVVS